MGARPLVFENPVVFLNDLKALCFVCVQLFCKKIRHADKPKVRKSEERLFCVALLFGVF